jgi:hypothetical protein
VNDILAQIGRLVRDPSVQIDVFGFVVALVISAFVSVVVAGLYQIFYEDRATGSRINRAFLLLGPSITALFIAVQFSLPLSLGLLGALSIVRFRTPIKEPEEIGFIMLLVGTSVVCATLQFMLLFALVVVATIVLLVQRFAPAVIGPKRRDGVLLLTVPGTATVPQREKLLEALRSKLVNGNLQGISYNDALMTVHYSFSGLPQQTLHELHRSLAEVGPVENLNIYFNRQGVLS